MAVRDSELLCHELLLRLAGRLSDRHLWRYRDWLAGDSVEAVAKLLPGTLVRNGIALDDDDHMLLREALLPLGADQAMVNAILPLTGPVPEYTFSAHRPAHSLLDSALLVLGATLRGRGGVREVRNSWREDHDGKLVIVVTAVADEIGLTGEVQRVLRALGELEPCVEVLPDGLEPTAYHRAALAESALVCAGAEKAAARR